MRTTLTAKRSNNIREQERFRDRRAKLDATPEECCACGEICRCKNGICYSCRRAVDHTNRVLDKLHQERLSLILDDEGERELYGDKSPVECLVDALDDARCEDYFAHRSLQDCLIDAVQR